jgi:aryl-alcohol dehydrogenase-like predicted oxidoreductase
VKAGKSRYIGLSECRAETLRRAHKRHPVAAVQMEDSLWFREPETTMLPTCRELGVGFVAYSPLGRGFLAGNFRSLNELPKDDNRRGQPRFYDGNVEHNLAIADGVRAIAARKSATPAQIALAWLLSRGEDILPIPGTKRRERQSENMGSLDVTLTSSDLQELDALVKNVAVKGDRYAPAMMTVLNG